MEWVELPARRYLSVARAEISEEFDLVNGEGGPVDVVAWAELLVRKKDQRVFRLAPEQPTRSPQAGPQAVPRGVLSLLGQYSDEERAAFEHEMAKGFADDRWTVPIIVKDGICLDDRIYLVEV